jgi:hypothetical protein
LATVQATLAGLQGLQGDIGTCDGAQIEILVQTHDPLPGYFMHLIGVTPLLALQPQRRGMATFS